MESELKKITKEEKTHSPPHTHTHPSPPPDPPSNYPLLPPTTAIITDTTRVTPT